MRIPREETDLLYDERLADAVDRIRGAVEWTSPAEPSPYLTVVRDDLRLVLQELDSLRDELKKQVY